MHRALPPGVSAPVPAPDQSAPLDACAAGPKLRPGSTSPSPSTVSSNAARPIGVYVHFPWCLKKCPYCDFLSIAQPDREQLPHHAYADQVLRELDRRLAVGLHQPESAQLQSIFFGGGTPSLWEPAALGRVLAGILARFPSPDPVEVTVECNPTSLDLDRANQLADAGVNRLSVGVQGLNDQRLKFLGRLHDAELGLDAVRAALASRVGRVSADVIFGVHGQSPAEAQAEVRRLAELGLEHVSAYALTIEPGTQFGALARKGRLPLLSDDRVADSFLAVEAELGRFGLAHYEVSNYARPGCESRHNLGYWRGHEYLGLGTGAWGTVRQTVEMAVENRTDSRSNASVDSLRNQMRYRNTPSAERYLSTEFSELDLSELGPSISDVEWLTPEVLLSERLMLGLRLSEGLDLERAAAELGAYALPPPRRRALERRLSSGQLEADWPSKPEGCPGRIWIPKAAWLSADAVIADLI